MGSDELFLKTVGVTQGANDKMIAAADACYANDWGCSVHQLGLRELITEARRTDASAQL